jgi:ribosomal protein S18 acetylase RimI-like enzyme
VGDASDAPIRVATPGDLERVARVVARFRDHLRRSDPGDATLRALLPDALADPGVEFCIAPDAGSGALGYTQTRFFLSVWEGGLEAQLEDLFVAPEARGAGLGSRLLDFALGSARARGARTIGLQTNEHNRAAQALYERAGFRLQREPIWRGGREVRWTKRLA